MGTLLRPSSLGLRVFDKRRQASDAGRHLTAFLVAVATAAGLAQQPDRSKTEAQAQRASERLRGLQREADQLAASERTLLNDLRKLEIERQIKTEELTRLTNDVDATRSELAATTARIGELAAQEESQRPELRARLVEIYKSGRARYLRLLLSASEVQRMGRAARMVGAIAQADQRRIAEHQQTIASLTGARRDLEAKGRQLQALRGEAERAAHAAAAAAQARSALVADIDRRRDLNAQLAGELMAAQQKLQGTLRNLSSGTPAAEPASLPIRPFRGALEWPVSGPLRRRFGATQGGAATDSRGIEIGAAEGTPVQAIHEGVVAYAEAFSGFGNLVIVDHGAQIFSLYGDLLELAVKRGARVEAGQAIGSVGVAPAGAAGLYFELRVDDRPVDPLQWLKKR